MWRCRGWDCEDVTAVTVVFCVVVSRRWLTRDNTALAHNSRHPMGYRFIALTSASFGCALSISCIASATACLSP